MIALALECEMKYIESKNGLNFVYLNNVVVFTTDSFREAIDFMKELK